MKGERSLAIATALSAIAASLALGLAGLYPGNNPDTFGHLAQGRQIAQLGHVPTYDSWSLLPGPPRVWLNYEWLSDLGTYLLYAQLGYTAVTLFKCLLLVVAALCLVRTAQLLAGQRAALFTSLTLIAAIPAIRTRLSDRPHVLGICLAALYLLLLTMLHAKALLPRARRGCLLIIFSVALLHLIWVNAHGSHLLGLAISGSFLLLCAREVRRWLVAVLCLQLTASCISPYGPAIWLDALTHVADPRYRGLVSEWQAWKPDDPVWLQLGPALQAALLALLLPRLLRSGPSVRAALPIAFLLAAACFRSIRFLAEFMLLSAPLIGVGLASLASSVRDSSVALAGAASAVLLGGLVPYACAQLPPWLSIGAGMSLAGLPSETGIMLRTHGIEPRVFAAMRDSWYLMFAAPESRFALDGRAPFYGPEYLKEILPAFGDFDTFTRMRELLGFNVVVLAYAASGEARVRSFVTRQPDWQLVLIEDLHASYVASGVLDGTAASAYQGLHVLQPSYGMGWLLDADAARSASIRAELAQLADKPGSAGYRAWVEGVLELAPLRRGGESDGFRWPRDAADWARYRRARPLISRAADTASDVPTVAALNAQLAAIFCDFDGAERALASALRAGPTREPLMTAQELALRRGQQDEVRKVVAAARRLPQGSNDPWLAELASGLDRTPACPP